MREHITELASGVDAIYASARNAIPAYHLDDLEALKKFSSQNGVPATVNIGGESFEVLPYNWQKYPVALRHENGQLGFTSSNVIPSIRLQIRSEFIHSVGAEAALSWFTEKLNQIEIYPAWTFSRIDLYVDIQGWDLSGFEKDRFLCRAKNISSYEEDGQFSGFTFGKRKSKTILCRIYNKTLELRTSKKLWTAMAWDENYDADLDVYRIEFEFNRNALKEFGLNTSNETLNSIAGLWSHATQEWLTHRDQVEDSNKSRWPISREWNQIQKASIAGSRIPIERIRESKEAVKIEALVAPLRGYLTSIGNLLGADDLSSTMGKVGDFYTKDEKKTGVSFASRIAEKRLRQA